MDQVLFRSLLLYLSSLMFRSLCIGLLAGACTLWVRNVAARHAIWVAVMIAMLVMPSADAVLPATWIPIRVERIALEQIQQIEVMQVVMVETVSRPALVLSTAPISAPHKAFPWWSLLTALYAIVGMALLARLALAHGKIAQLKRRSRPVSSILSDEIAASHGLQWRVPQLRESDAVRVPITIGFLRPVVILPTDWNTWEEFQLRAVLGHEFAHVRRADWAIATVAAFNKCVFWLNPLAFFLERNLSELAERACDDAALSLTHDPARYAEVLLQFATAHDGHRLLTGGVAMARHNMRSRIERVLAMKRTGSGVLKLAGWTLVMVLAMPVLYAAAAIQVSSNAAPAPSYAEIIAQLPLPRVPQRVEPQQIAQLQTTTQSAVPPQTGPAPQDPRELARQLGSIATALAQAQSNITPPALAQLAELQTAIAQSREIQRQLNSAQEQYAAMLAEAQSGTTPAAITTARIQRAMDQSRVLERELNILQNQLLAMNARARESTTSKSAQELANAFAQAFDAQNKGLQDLFALEAQSRPASAPAAAPLPKIITRVEPVYPPAMRTAGIEGSVRLSVTIGPDGHVLDIKTVSQTNPVLGTAAIDAVKQWVFEPTLVAGKPATITVEVPVDFKLQTQTQRNSKLGGSIEYAQDALLNLPDNQDDLLAYLSQLAKLRGGDGKVVLYSPDGSNVFRSNPGGLASTAVASTPTPFSFTLTTDQKGTYSIQTGGSSYTYECHGAPNCRFLMSGSNYLRMIDVNPSDYGVHVTGDQGPKQSDLVLTCEARECVITSVENGKSVKHTLKSNEAVTISEAAKISGVVN